MNNLDEFDFNEMTFGRFNPSFQNVGPFTPPNINTNSPMRIKSKRDKQLEERFRNYPELFLDNTTEKENKKLIPIPKTSRKNNKGGKRKTKRIRKRKTKKKGGGRKDEYGKRTTKNTKKKDKQGINLGSSKGTRAKIANFEKENHKKENNKK